MEGVIRRTLLQAYSNKEFLSRKALHARLMEDPGFPRMCDRTLLNIMRKQLKFRYRKFHTKPVPFEREDITIARHKYLKAVRHYRVQGYKVSEYYNHIHKVRM